MSKITFILGEEKRVTEQRDNTLICEAAASIGLPIDMACGGLGKCGQCRIIIESGGNSPDETERALLSTQELDAGIRLACRARIQGDTTVIIAPSRVYSNKLINETASGDLYTGQPAGLAIDLGTTCVAAYIVDLETGKITAGAASLNQQQIYGSDVISRLSASVRSEEHRFRLSRLALSSITRAISGLNMPLEIFQKIKRTVIVGNPPMHHLLLKLPVDTLAKLPFQPFSTLPLKNAGISLNGFAGNSTRVDMPPLVGGFVGSDALACLASFDFDSFKEPQLAVDLGTNGEVLLSDGARIYAASTAAGPAFEGVNISCGMRAEEGAVTGVRLHGDEFAFSVLGDGHPKGLAGSGLMQVIYELVRAGVIEKSGKIPDGPPALNRGVEHAAGRRGIWLTKHRDIFLTQKDIREFQKAKGAVSAAISVLMKSAGLVPDDLKRVTLTGSFGEQLDIEAACGLGIIPDINRSLIRSVPNGAGTGAAIFLSDDGFKRGERIAKMTRHIDLDSDPDFHNIFINSLRFK